jgi:hypothetical protein
MSSRERRSAAPLCAEVRADLGGVLGAALENELCGSRLGFEVSG